MSSTTSEMSLKVEALRHFTTRSFKPCAIYDTMLNKASIRVIIEVIFYHSAPVLLQHYKIEYLKFKAQGPCVPDTHNTKPIGITI
jgi:hypothetical protein